MVFRFEWDEAKAAINARKHDITFEFAQRVFLDPLRLTEIDGHVGGEERWRTYGLVRGFLILLVVHTIRDEDGDEVFRIISAREANRAERKYFEQNR